LASFALARIKHGALLRRLGAFTHGFVDLARALGRHEVSSARVNRNIAANYLGKLWGIASVYAFVPIYIELLGIESYGVIAFQGVLLAILWIADSGLTPAFSREAARSDDLPYLRNVLCAMERVYLSICLAVAIGMLLCSGWIANSWLKTPTHVASDELQVSIALMSIGIACQLAMSLYFGGLMGRQKQVLANGL
jgi:O-antigen/teichoic acid export membrane protein